ncbi:T9SS type A sorting domain-containing protein [Thermophagus sp. OGC60D27]|uniref:T9SS type A sorting domain-containing protein n=1 Tax=Thermophagus sp. OGC60D27 TaxID=3458415 RepID=UPI004037BDA2
MPGQVINFRPIFVRGPVLGAITGILNYSFGEYKIAPRFNEDLEEVPTAVADVSLVEGDIWPNPAGKTLHVRAQEAIASIRMVTLSGKSEKIVSVDGANSFTMDVSELPRGIYLVKIVTLSGQSEVHKVMLQ